jgi:hypothetical protein
MFQFLAKRRSSAKARSISEIRKQRGFRVRRVGLEMLEPRRVLSTVNWTGGGDHHSWGDANNWDTHALPGATDDVKINVAGPLTITHSSGNDTVLSITSTSSQVGIDLSGGSLSASANSTINGAFTNEASLHIAAGGLNLNGGMTSAGGTFVVDAGGSLSLRGGETFDSASSISGAGNVEFDLGSATIAGTYNITGATDFELVTGNVVDFSGNVLNAGQSLHLGIAVGGNVPVVTFHNTPISVTNLALDNGVLTTGPIQANNFNWSDGTLQGTGDVNVTGSLTIESGSLLGRTLNNFGTGVWSAQKGAEEIELLSGATFNNEVGGTLAIQNLTSGAVGMQVDGTGTFSNAGSITVALQSLSSFSSVNCAANNTGHIDIQSGRFSLTGGVSSTAGAFTVASGASLALRGGETFDSASSISGAGNVEFDPGSATIAGTYNITGATDFELVTGNVVDFSGNVLNVGQSLHLGIAVGGNVPVVTFHNTPISVTNLALDNGVLTTGPIQTTNFNWDAGTLQGTGDVNVTGSLTIGGSNNNALVGRALNNFGSATWSTVTGFGQIHLMAGATLNNEPGGTFMFQNRDLGNESGVLMLIDGDGAFNNAGNLLMAPLNPTNPSAIQCTFNNTGRLDVQSGHLSFNGGYHQTGPAANTILDGGSISNNAPLDIQAGQITGSGTISGSVTNSGQVVPGTLGNPIGVIQITGKYVQTSSGALGIVLRGTAAGTQYSQLKVGGLATLDGTLDVSLVNGFTPAANDTFQVLTFGSRIGDFALKSGLDLGNHRVLTPTFNPTNLTLQCEITVVPLTVTVQPSTRTYGQANPMFSVSYAGFLPGDDSSALGGHLVFNTPATQASDVGNYLVTASGLTSDKYDITYVSGNLSIMPAPLTVKANNATWAIGAPFPTNFSASYSGFVLGQNPSALGGTLSFSTTANQNSSVGNYPIVPSGLTSTNYAISYVNGTLTVTPQIVAIDIKPESLNIDQNGTITVVVFGSSTFDVSGISVGAVKFAGVSVGVFNQTLNDKNGDGRIDLTLQFKTSDALKAALTEIYSNLLLNDYAGDQQYATRQDALLALDGTFGQYGQQFEGQDTTTIFLAGNSLKTLLSSLGI